MIQLNDLLRRSSQERRRMIQTSVYRMLVVIVTVVVIGEAPVYPTIQFDNFGSNICLKESDAKLILHNAEKVVGWSQQSILKSYGNNPSTEWFEKYTSGATVSQSGGTHQPSTYFVINNSNALTPLRPTDFNATIGQVYCPNHVIFRGGEVPVQGFIRLNNGFTILKNASAIFDTWVPIAGGIDLRETGTLILNSPMYLGSSFTFTSGGNIVGNGHSLFLGGDLTLAGTEGYRVIHIKDDLIIDGRGSIFSIEKGAQLFVDTNVSLTLRNMTLRTAVGSVATPAVKLGSLNSYLTLDNVVLALGDDYKLAGGSLFIDNDVAVTGSSAFIYSSPFRSHIAPHSTWYFDCGTTLSIAPITHTLNRTLEELNRPLENDFILMGDATSRLYLNGASLLATTTGLQLTTGTLLVDNKVRFDSHAQRQFVSISKTVPDATTGGFPYWAYWSPDGRFLAVANSSDQTIQIFAFNGFTCELVGQLPTGSDVDSINWSPDGRFIAVANYTAQQLEIFTFAGKGSLRLLGVAPTGGPVNDVTWSPDCRYVAVVNDDPVNTLQIFTFNGETIGLVGTVATQSAPYAVDWSPDGAYLVVANFLSNTGQAFLFMGDTNPLLILTIPTDDGPYDVAISPDGYYAAVACYGGLTVQVFSLVGQIGTSVSPGNTPSGVGWSPTGRYMAVPCDFDNTLSVYQFDPGGTMQLMGVPIATGAGAKFGYFSPNGNHIAVVCSNDDLLQIFDVNYNAQEISQPWSNAINFGNAAKGPGYDLNVRMLSGARVLVTGQVQDDSA
jgi:DNA-binding beta-propeller fold protein YncE